MRSRARPRDGLRDRPAARALAVATELRGEAVEAVQHVALRVPELEAADDRRDGELALADKRLRVDGEPRLALRGEHVVAVQVLVQQHLFALRVRERVDRLPRRVAELRERQLRIPPPPLVPERVERLRSPKSPTRQTNQPPP